jgi:hypothetical protein
MKKIILTIIAVATAITLNAQGGAHFQFKITSDKGMSGTMDVKHGEAGSLSEMNMASPKMPGGAMIIKSLSKKSTPDVSYIIDDKNKTYREQKKSTHQNHEEKDVTVKKVGDETVNGYKCAHAIITEGNGTSEVWNSKDFGDYEKYMSAMDDKQMAFGAKRQKALKDAGCDGFPVKMIRKGEKDGGMTMELVKYEKKSFSASEFEIPAGYTKTEATANPYSGAMGIKSQEEIMKMTPEERAKYIEEMKKKYGK